MHAGELDKRIELLEPQYTTDEFNQQVEGAPKVTGPIWAKIAPLSGREYRQGKQVESDTTHEITIRYQSGRRVTSEWQLRYKQRTFELTAPPINPDERGEWLVLQCKETA